MRNRVMATCVLLAMLGMPLFAGMQSDGGGKMLDCLLRFNTHDNMLTTHPPFQIDGNLGMVAAVCEILLEKSIPPDWPHGKITGLRTREGRTVNEEW